jgi:hypothetical protein
LPDRAGVIEYRGQTLAGSENELIVLITQINPTSLLTGQFKNMTKCRIEGYTEIKRLIERLG